MIETPALRRLLVVDPCDDCYRLLPGLRSVGWDVDSCSLENAADRTCDVGLLRLQPFHLERPEAVKELISEMRHIADSVNLSSETIEALGKESEKISSVVKVIKDLAAEHRTMLLVTHDMRLAADVRTILGSGVKIS